MGGDSEPDGVEHYYPRGTRSLPRWAVLATGGGSRHTLRVAGLTLGTDCGPGLAVTGWGRVQAGAAGVAQGDPKPDGAEQVLDKDNDAWVCGWVGLGVG